MVLELARQVLEDEEVDFDDLYGQDPTGLSPKERQNAFMRVTAGSDVRNPRLVPVGPCNRDRALFMCHPINGLDDLYFTIQLGAQPCARLHDGRLLSVPMMWLFLNHPWFRNNPDDMRQLRDTYCRNLDPTVAAGAYSAASVGASIALADPPGVYMWEEDFDVNALYYRSERIDERWVRWRRPDEGTRHQRLEVGPSDDDAAFLDDIEVRRGSITTPLTGGFQLLELLSVGLQLVVGEPTPLKREDYYLLQPWAGEFRCGSRASEVCQQLAAVGRVIDGGAATIQTTPTSPRLRRTWRLTGTWSQ